MIVGIIGSGGREHAICTKIKESSKTGKIFCIPGNAGTNNIAENIDIKIDKMPSDTCQAHFWHCGLNFWPWGYFGGWRAQTISKKLFKKIN